MSAELTKESRKALKNIYALYRERRKEGKSKGESVYFNDPVWGGGPKIEGMDEAAGELSNSGFIRTDITGGFELTDKAIIFMENFKKDALMKWLEFGTQFIP